MKHFLRAWEIWSASYLSSPDAENRKKEPNGGGVSTLLRATK